MALTSRSTAAAGFALSLLVFGSAVGAAQQPPPAQPASAPRQQPPPRQQPSTPATSKQDATTKLAAADVTFIQTAGRDGKAEVELAQVAQQKASASVKSFADRLVDDHSRANAELMTLAQQKGVTVPDVSSSQKAMKGKLDALSGATFDRTFAGHMVEDHEKAVAAFTKATSSKDADVKAFAEKTLPTLKAHLAQAKELQGSLAPAKPATTSTSKPSTSAPPAPKPAPPK